MDINFSRVQLALSVIMLGIVIIEIVLHAVMGHITSVGGYLVSGVFLALSYGLARLSYKEVKEHNK